MSEVSIPRTPFKVNTYRDGTPLSFDEDGPDDPAANSHSFTYRGNVYVAGIFHHVMESTESGIRFAVSVKDFEKYAHEWPSD